MPSDIHIDHPKLSLTPNVQSCEDTAWRGMLAFTNREVCSGSLRRSHERLENKPADVPGRRVASATAFRLGGDCHAPRRPRSAWDGRQNSEEAVLSPQAARGR